MEIIEKKLSEIYPYENNPRKNDTAAEYVAESIRQFGFKVPIVIDENNVIVAGHTRYKAAQILEMQKVPCIVADDLTEEQVKAFRLADNKVAEKSRWDFDMLKDELDSISGILMGDFGFPTMKDIDLDSFTIKEEDEEIEEQEEDPKPHMQQCPHCHEWVEV